MHKSSKEGVERGWVFQGIGVLVFFSSARISVANSGEQIEK